MKKEKIPDGVLLCLKILLPILIAVPLVYFIAGVIECRISDLENIGNEDYFSGTGLYVALSHMVLFVVNVVLTVIGIIGLVVAKKHTSASAHRKNVIAFRCLALAPLGSQLLYFIAILIILKIG